MILQTFFYYFLVFSTIFVPFKASLYSATKSYEKMKAIETINILL